MPNTRKLLVLFASTACIAFYNPSTAKAEILTFDELASPTPVNGLTVKGVTFGFKINGVDSPDAIYNSSFPPQIPPNVFANIKQPFLEGNGKGILSLDFAAPISALQFNVGLESFAPIASGLTVELFDAGLKSLGITSVNTTPLAALSEGLFSYSGAAVKKAVLDFDASKFGLSPAIDPRFNIDNLSYTSIPEPSLLVSLFAFSSSVYLSRKKRQKV
jgi:hypothetical protein